MAETSSVTLAQSFVSNAKLLQKDIIDAQLHIGYDPDAEQTDRKNILGLFGHGADHDFSAAKIEEFSPAGIVNNFIKNLGPAGLVFSPDTIGGNGTSPSDSNIVTLNSPDQSLGNIALLGGLAGSALEYAAFNGPGAGNNALGNDTGEVNTSAYVSVDPGGGGPTDIPPGPDDPQPPDNINPPDVSAANANGTENTPVLLSIGLISDPDATATVVIIGNVPSGASLSAGINNGNGTWSLTPAQLIGLTITPPQYFSGNINLSVTAVSTAPGQTLTDMASSTVTIAGVATTPLLVTPAANGLEDTAIPLTISANLIDTDGSEVLSILIVNVPLGSTLSSGTDNGNGTWSLTPAQLNGLTLTPPLNYSGQIALTVIATSAENGTTASNQSVLSVNVGGVADTPTLVTAPASGAEDTSIPVSIAAALTDTDGSETLTIVISNVPAGSIFSAGINNGNGTWTLNPGQLNGLTFTPPQHLSGAFSLTVTATASENGTSSSSVSTLNIAVAGSATPPFLNVTPASGNEDTPIPLSINAGLNDTDGSETLGITIGNVPAGASLSAGINNGNGTWSLTPAQLTGLTITPPLNFSGTLALSVTATSTEGSSSSVLSSPLNVNVEGVADMPTLSVAAASGTEDTPIALTINAALTDTDGSETLFITVANVPAGATLSAGTNNGNGTWTLTPAQLTSLTITPPLHSSGIINLSITATSAENGTTATTPATALSVTVTGTATPPSLNVVPASGNEDTAIPLTITAGLVDTDGSEILSLTIGNVPLGATLSAGTDLGGGVWSLTPAQLTGLTLTPPLNYSGIIPLNVTAITTEGVSTATTPATLNVTVAGVADTPTLSVSPASGNEGTAIALTITSALTDTDGSETLSITIGGIPAGATLSAGINNGNGIWSLTPAQLAGLMITPPPFTSGLLNLTVTATASENGTSATSSSTLGVTINPVGTPPTLSTTPASGDEDTSISLTINAALVDITETLSITIDNVPAGAILSAGIDNGDGSWTLTPAQITGLTLTPPLNYSGIISLSVIATSTDGINSSSIVNTLPVTVNGVADMPTLSVSPASGAEDTAIALNITSALTDTDGSETLSITIAGVPAGALLSAGTNNGNGTWTLTSAQLSGLTITPPPHSSGVINLTVTATASENATSATAGPTALSVTVSGVATTPSLSVVAATGNEDTAIPLTINAALLDTDGSETLGISITGVPTGATLSAGINNGGGNWSLIPAQLAGLTMTPPANYSGVFSLTVTAISSENATNASTQATLPVTIVGVADTPLLSVQAATGGEDTSIPLTITSALTDTDGSETLSLLISNVPLGAVLSAGLYKGSGQWSLAPSDLAGLSITPPDNFSGVITLMVTAISTENNGDDTTITVPLNVTVTSVVDTPVVNISAVTGYEDTPIALHIGSALADTDGSEVLSITITGVPAGATLSAGTNNGGGSWTLTQAQLNNITITPPANSNTDFNLNVAITSTENGGGSVTINSTLHVDVVGVADLPTSTASNAVGAAGAIIPLTIGGALTDTDGSENLTFVIHGMPDGFALNHGLNNGDNTWTLTPAQLAGLSLISPHTFEGQLNLRVTAVSHENDGDVRVGNATAFNVRIGDYSHGYLVDLGIGIGVGGIGVGVHVGLLPDIDLFPAAGGILGTNGIDVKEDTPFLIADAPALLGLPLLSAVLGLVATIQFSGIPTGVTFSSGTNLGGGVWRFTSAQLNNLYMMTPANSDADFNIGVHANLLFGLADIFLTSNPVHVLGIADMPTLAVTAGAANEDTPISLNISGALTDTDGSESLSFLVSGMPPGFTLNHGIQNGNGTWSLTPAQLAGLTIIPADDYSGIAHVTVSSISTEREGDQAVRQQTIAITINPAIDTPVLAPSHAHGNEDQSVTLNFGIALGDTDGSEQITALLISGLPSGTSLLGATDNGNGTWSADINHLDQVRFVPPSNWSGDALLNISLTVREGATGPQTTVNSSLSLHIEGIADTPLASAGDVSGESHQAIGMNLSAALTDTDGSEALSVVISGLPQDFIFNHGLNNGDGSWTLHGSDLSSLNLTSSENFVGDVNLTMTVFAIESNGHVASTQQDFTVHVTPDI